MTNETCALGTYIQMGEREEMHKQANKKVYVLNARMSSGTTGMEKARHWI